MRRFVKITGVIINYFLIFLMAFLSYLAKDSIIEITWLNTPINYLIEKRFWVYLFSVVYLAVYQVSGSIKMSRIKKEMLEQINDELFGKDFKLHRITIYKEVSWVEAFFKNLCCYCYYHILNRKHKDLSDFWLPISNYLVIDCRCAFWKARTHTMFKTKEDGSQKWQGLAGRIYYFGTSAVESDFPDIDLIDLSNYSKEDDITDEKTREDVKNYMSKGDIHSLKILKKMRKKARHFYGTLLTRESNKKWGVLLIDSFCVESPFKELENKPNQTIIKADLFSVAIKPILIAEG